MALWTETLADAPYGPHPENQLDITRARWRRKGPFACAVVFHGGSWQFGDREEPRERVCRRYLAKGFLVINVEYRHGIAAAAEDAGCALEWCFRMASSYNIDPGKIVVTGESAGAHLVLHAAFQSRFPVAAVINFYGVSDLCLLLDSTSMRDVLPPEDTKLAAERLSPIRHIGEGVCPVLSIHGTADSIVPLEQTTLLTEGIRRAGGTAKEILVEAGGHGFSEAQTARVYRAVFDFLRDLGVR